MTGRIEAHRAVKQVRDAVEDYALMLRGATIGLNRASTLLSESRNDHHTTLLLYLSPFDLPAITLDRFVAHPAPRV